MYIECTFQVANLTYVYITHVMYKYVRIVTSNVHSMYTYVLLSFISAALFGLPTQYFHFRRPSSVFWKFTLYVHFHVHANYIFNVSTKNVSNERTMNLLSLALWVLFLSGMQRDFKYSRVLLQTHKLYLLTSCFARRGNSNNASVDFGFRRSLTRSLACQHNMYISYVLRLYFDNLLCMYIFMYMQSTFSTYLQSTYQMYIQWTYYHT
jgi:hypothetical protein